MKHKNGGTSENTGLRQQIEARLRLLEPLAEELSPSEALTMIHKLRVRQAELEIQNEELRLSQSHLEKSEKTLIENTNKLEALFRAAPLAIIALDLTGNVTLWNPAAEGMFGWSEEEVLGRIPPSVPDDKRAELKAMLERAGQGESLVGVETQRYRKDGSIIDISIFTAPLYDINGKVVGNIGMLEDITDRKQTEEALETQVRVLESMAEGVVVTNNKGIIVFTNPAFDAMFGYQPGELVGKHASTLNDFPPEENVKIVREILRELKTRGAWFGEFFNRRKDGSSFLTSANVSILEVAGKKLYISVQEDITERKRAEAALKEANDRLRALIQASPLAIIGLDNDGRVMSWNQAAERLFGWSAKEILGQPLPTVPEEEREQLQKTIRQSLTGEGFVALETRRRKRDGSLVEVRLNSAPIRDARGEVQGSVRILEDFTERKRTEEALARSQAEFEAIFNSISEAITFANLQRQVVMVNPAFKTIFGYDPEEAVGQSTAIFYADQADYEEQGKIRYRPDAQGSPYVFEVEYRRKDGSTFPAETMGTQVRDAQGNILGFVGVHRDVTERKRLDQALRESRDDLNRAQAVAHTGSWRLDVRKKELTWSDESYRIFGILQGTPLTYETFLGAVHPEDREYVDREWTAALKGEPYDIEHRIVVGDTLKWVRERAELEFDKEGRLLGGFGTCQDITQRKRAEDALQRARDELELQVQERTAELQFTVRQLKAEIEERLQAEEKLRNSERKLRRLSTQLLTAQEDERKRLAGELHDELGHALLTWKLQLQLVEKNLLPEQKILSEELHAILAYINEVIDNVRRLYLDLSPGDLEDLGLTSALRSLVSNFSRMNNLEVSMELDDTNQLFPRPAQIIIYRVIQEILTNIGKHANAKALSITVRKEKNSVFFDIEDNGKGFDVEQVPATQDKGLGLMAMDERVKMLGGSLEIWSQKNLGTRLSFTLPTRKWEGQS